jgi:hypothetical protein
VIQGSTDQMMPAAYARAYAAQAESVRYRELPGGHFVFLSKYDRIRPWVRGFLMANEQRK